MGFWALSSVSSPRLWMPSDDPPPKAGRSPFESGYCRQSAPKGLGYGRSNGPARCAMSDLTYYVLIAIAVHLCLTLLQALYRRLQNSKFRFEDAVGLAWLCLPIYVEVIRQNLGGEPPENILSFIAFLAFWYGLSQFVERQWESTTPKELLFFEMNVATTGGKLNYLLFVLPVFLFCCGWVGVWIQMLFDALMGWHVGTVITGFAAYYLYWHNKKNKLSETNRKEGAYQYGREQQRRISALEEELKRLREELAGYRPEHSKP